MNFLFVCPSVGSFVHWKMEKWDNLRSFQDIFTKIGTHVTLDLFRRLAHAKFEFLVCVSVSWFICSLKMEKWYNLLSFEDIFTKIGRHLLLDLSHRLARMKLKFFVCVSVSWFICSLRNRKIECFPQFSMVFNQTWWTSSRRPSSQINLNKISYFWFVCLSVGSLMT